jgi:hypothetical protein
LEINSLAMPKNYQDSRYSFPNDNIDPELKKRPEYALKYAQAAYSLHQKDEGGVRNARNREIALLRLHAQGRQPVEKYLDILCPKDAMGKRKTYLDLSTDPISVIPKFRSIVIGKFMQMSHDVEANAVDEKSGAERRKKRHELWSRAVLEAKLKPFESVVEAGVPPQQAKQIVPRTVEELDMMESVGSFKLLWETGMEKLLKDFFHTSDWEDIKYRLYEDIFDIGAIATRDFTDKASGKAMCRYVDQEKVIKRFSRDKKYRNIDYAGEVLDLSPNQIRTDAGEELPIEIIEQVIEEHNHRTNYDFTYENGVEGFYEKHGNIALPVLDITWKTVDTIKQEKRRDDRGEYHYNTVPYDYKKKNKTGKREILEGKIQMVYSCKWIVGTDYVYDYGVEEDIIRPTPKTVKLPFNFYRLTDKSLLELIIPFEDNLNLGWLRFQNGIAKAAPPGIAVDISAINNVTNGKNQINPMEVLQIRRETGDLLFSATTHHSQVINPNAGRPIFDLPGGAGAYLKEQMEIIQFNIGMIRDTTGINELMDASTPNPRTGLGTAEIAQQGTNNTLYTLYNAYKSVKEGTASNGSFRIQNIIRYKDYKPYENIIGSSLINIFKQGSPISEASFGIKLTLKPSAQEKQSIIEKASIAYNERKLDFSDLMFIEQEVKYGSTKYARMYIAYKEEKYREEDAATTQRNTQEQSQAIMEQQENAKQGRMEEVSHQTDESIRERAAASDIEVNEYSVKNEYKKDEDDNKSKNKVMENLTS